MENISQNKKILGTVVIKECKKNDNNFDTVITLNWSGKSTKIRILWQKKAIGTQYINVDNIVIPKLTETKNISEHLLRYLDEVIRPLVLILPKMIKYVKSLKKKNNQLMTLCVGDKNLIETYKTI